MNTTLRRKNHKQRQPQLEPVQPKPRPSAMGFRIRSHAAIEPDTLKTSEELDRELGLRPGTCWKKSGVHTRRYARQESLTALGARAVQTALNHAGLSLRDCDALIACGASCEQHIPCGAVLIQRALGQSSSGVSCFDVDATCLGFLRALELSVRLVNSGAYKRIMIVAAEKPSIALNPNDPKTSALFGDGAAAMLIEAPPQEGPCFLLHDADFASYGEYAEACELIGGGARLSGLEYSAQTHEEFLFKMQGPTLFKACLKTFPPFVTSFLERNHTSMEQFRWVIPHQASRAGLKQIQKHLRIPSERILDILETHGNQVAASIPTAFSTTLATQDLMDGDEVLLLGTGAGLGLGIVRLEWRAA